MQPFCNLVSLLFRQIHSWINSNPFYWNVCADASIWIFCNNFTFFRMLLSQCLDPASVSTLRKCYRCHIFIQDKFNYVFNTSIHVPLLSSKGSDQLRQASKVSKASRRLIIPLSCFPVFCWCLRYIFRSHRFHPSLFSVPLN